MPGPVKSAYTQNVYTSPLAVIRIGGQVIGKMQNLTLTEDLPRTEVRELGNVYTVELPLNAITCSFTAAAFVVDFDGLGNVPNPFWPLQARTSGEFANTILLGEVSVDIELYSRYSTSGRQRLIKGPEIGEGEDIKFYPMGTAKDAVITNRNIAMALDQVAIQNITGRYLRPIMVMSSPGNM